VWVDHLQHLGIVAPQGVTAVRRGHIIIISIIIVVVVVVIVIIGGRPAGRALFWLHGRRSCREIIGEWADEAR
jgi:hypothetical protein